MHKSNEDCFYFLTSSCAKGSSCQYRHSPLALACNVICPSWLCGNCLNPTCPFRHSTAQRPMVGNGILCFFENTPTGCLKPDCTFVHSRPRLNLRNTSIIRPSTINLINKEVPKSAVANVSLTDTSSTVQISNTNIETQQTTQPPIAIPILKSASDSDSSISKTKTEAIPRRIALPSNVGSQSSPNEKSDPSENNNNRTDGIKMTSRSVIADSTKQNQEETSGETRLISNRSIVIAETANISNRIVVQPSSSSRVIISSDSSSTRPNEKVIDRISVEQENKSKKLKSDLTTTVNISFPCTTTSIKNRLLLTSSKETVSTNDNKPIRLKRDIVPVTETSTTNASITVTSSTNGEKISAGTGLSQDDKRRTLRIERFQKKTISPPRPNISSTLSTVTTPNDVVKISPPIQNLLTTIASNERKRNAPETADNDEPSRKRLTISSLAQNNNLVKQNDNSSLEKHQQHASLVTKITSLPSKVSSCDSPPAKTKLSKISPIIVEKGLPSRTKSIENISSSTTNNDRLSNESLYEQRTKSTSNEEEEYQLLKMNETTDIVDTFAAIDEALLEADHLLDLI